MPAYFALATSVGVLAVLATWLFGLPISAENNLQVWTAFIAWGCHFHSGGGTKGSTTTVACMSWGALVGFGATLLFQGPLAGLDTLAAPVAVGIGAALICLSSKVPLLATIPASVYGFAAIFGLLLLKPGMLDNPQATLLPIVISVIIGAAFGYVSEWLSGAITKKGADAS